MNVVQKETLKLRQGTDELKSRWVQFHNGKLYLLPVIEMHQKMVPVFADDGSVSMSVETPDQRMADLEKMVQKFYAAIATVKGNIITATLDVYADFISFVRFSLTMNYDFTTDELKSILTLTKDEFSALFQTMMSHIVTLR